MKMTSKLIAPVKAKITSDFGVRKHPISKQNKPHWGIDFGSPIGTDVCAANSGIVIWSGYNKSFGKTIIIEHEDFLLTLYAHLKEYQITSGDYVKQGDAIGKVGNTGQSTAPHLHFETIDGKMIYAPKYLHGKGSSLRNFIKSADKLAANINGYKAIGIAGNIGRLDPKIFIQFKQSV